MPKDKDGRETKKLKDLEVEAYLIESCDIEPTLIQEEYVRVPRDLAYWNQRYVNAFQEYQFQKIATNRTRMMLTIRHREALLQSGVKVTESQVEAKVSTDTEMEDAEVALVYAEVEREKMRGVLDAVRAKKDMLVSIGAHIRAELQGDPSVRNQSAAARQYGRGDGG